MTNLTTLTGTQLVAEFNARAEAAGVATRINSVKLSKAQLIAKIEALPKPAKAKPTTGVTVADFARDNGVNPKVARAALRRNGLTGPYELSKQIVAIIKAMAPQPSVSIAG